MAVQPVLLLSLLARSLLLKLSLALRLLSSLLILDQVIRGLSRLASPALISAPGKRQPKVGFLLQLSQSSRNGIYRALLIFYLPAYCDFGPYYTKSSTFTAISGETFSIEYGDGEYLTGIMGTEEVTVAGIKVDQEVALVTAAAWEGDGTTSGLMGLAYPAL
jgi:hypothetical protein